MKKTINYILLTTKGKAILKQIRAEKAKLYDLLGEQVGGGCVETATISGLDRTYVLMYSDDLDIEPELNPIASEIANKNKYNTQILMKVHKSYYSDRHGIDYWERLTSLTKADIKMLEKKYHMNFERENIE